MKNLYSFLELETHSTSLLRYIKHNKPTQPENFTPNVMTFDSKKRNFEFPKILPINNMSRNASIYENKITLNLFNDYNNQKKHNKIEGECLKQNNVEYNKHLVNVVQEFSKMMVTYKQYFQKMLKQKIELVNRLQDYITQIENSFNMFNNIYKKKFQLLDYVLSNIESPNLLMLIHFIHTIQNTGFQDNNSFRFDKDFNSNDIENYISFLSKQMPEEMPVVQNKYYKSIFQETQLLFPYSFVSSFDFQSYMTLVSSNFFSLNFNQLDLYFSKQYETDIRNKAEMVLNDEFPELLDKLDKNYYSDLNPSKFLEDFTTNFLFAPSGVKMDKKIIKNMKIKIKLIFENENIQNTIPLYLVFLLSLVKRINSSIGFIKNITKSIIQHEFPEKAENVQKRFQIISAIINNNKTIQSNLSAIESKYKNNFVNSDLLINYIQTLLFIEEPFNSYEKKEKQMISILDNVQPNILEKSNLIQIYLDYFGLFLPSEKQKKVYIQKLYWIFSAKTCNLKCRIILIKWLLIQIQKTYIDFDFLNNEIHELLNYLFVHKEYDLFANAIILLCEKRHHVNSIYHFIQNIHCLKSILSNNDNTAIQKVKFSFLYCSIILQEEEFTKLINKCSLIQIDSESKKNAIQFLDIHCLFSYIHPILPEKIKKKKNHLSEVFGKLETKQCKLFPKNEFVYHETFKTFNEDVNYFIKKITHKSSALYTLDCKDYFIDDKSESLCKRIQTFGKSHKHHILYCQISNKGSCRISNEFLNNNSFIFVEKQPIKKSYEYELKGLVVVNNENNKFIYLYDRNLLSWYSLTEKKYLDNVEIPTKNNLLLLVYFKKNVLNKLTQLKTIIPEKEYITQEEKDIYNKALLNIYTINPLLCEMNINFLQPFFNLGTLENVLLFYDNITQSNMENKSTKFFYLLLSKVDLKNVTQNHINFLQENFSYLSQDKLVKAIENYVTGNEMFEKIEIEQMKCGIKYFLNNINYVNKCSEKLLLWITLFLSHSAWLSDHRYLPIFINWLSQYLGKKPNKDNFSFLSKEFQITNKYIHIFASYLFKISSDGLEQENKIYRFYSQIFLFTIYSMQECRKNIKQYLTDIFNNNPFCFQTNPNLKYTEEQKFGLELLYKIINLNFQNLEDTYYNLITFIFEFKMCNENENENEKLYFSLLQKLVLKDYLLSKVKTNSLYFPSKMKYEKINKIILNISQECQDFQTLFVIHFYYKYTQIEKYKKKIEQINVNEYISNYPSCNLGFFLLFIFLNTQFKKEINCMFQNKDDTEILLNMYDNFKKHNKLTFTEAFIKQHQIEDCITKFYPQKEYNILSKMFDTNVFTFLNINSIKTFYSICDVMESTTKPYMLTIIDGCFLITDKKFTDPNKITEKCEENSKQKLKGIIINCSKTKYVFILNDYNYHWYSLIEREWISSIEEHLKNENSIQMVSLIYVRDQITDDTLSSLNSKLLNMKQELDFKLESTQMILKWYRKNHLQNTLLRSKTFKLKKDKD